jgi:hypothetical protein
MVGAVSFFCASLFFSSIVSIVPLLPPWLGAATDDDDDEELDDEDEDDDELEELAGGVTLSLSSSEMRRKFVDCKLVAAAASCRVVACILTGTLRKRPPNTSIAVDRASGDCTNAESRRARFPRSIFRIVYLDEQFQVD